MAISSRLFVANRSYRLIIKLWKREKSEKKAKIIVDNKFKFIDFALVKKKEEKAKSSKELKIIWEKKGKSLIICI